jgi:hypothetical protein
MGKRRKEYGCEGENDLKTLKINAERKERFMQRNQMRRKINKK